MQYFYIPNENQYENNIYNDTRFLRPDGVWERFSHVGLSKVSQYDRQFLISYEDFMHFCGAKKNEPGLFSGFHGGVLKTNQEILFDDGHVNELTHVPVVMVIDGIYCITAEELLGRDLDVDMETAMRIGKYHAKGFSMSDAYEITTIAQNIKESGFVIDDVIQFLREQCGASNRKSRFLGAKQDLLRKPNPSLDYLDYHE